MLVAATTLAGAQRDLMRRDETGHGDTMWRETSDGGGDDDDDADAAACKRVLLPRLAYFTYPASFLPLALAGRLLYPLNAHLATPLPMPGRRRPLAPPPTSNPAAYIKPTQQPMTPHHTHLPASKRSS
jgi:hypothetical protein